MTSPSIFTEFGFYLAADTPPIPLINHPQIPFIIDSLGRLERHHIAIISHQSEKIHRALIKAVAHVIHLETTKTFKNSQFIYFDAIRFSTAYVSKEKIAHDFQALVSSLKTHNQRLIFAINQLDFLNEHDANFSMSYLNHLIKQILTHDEWRLITFISETNQLKKLNIEHLFSATQLIDPKQEDVISLLKNYRVSLENFHHTIISDENITHAYAMATHYLPGASSFDKTLALLDGAAFRANLLNHSDHPEQKSLLTPQLLAQVISHSTQIPVAHLSNMQFQVSKLIDTLSKHVFGQDAAIKTIASLLQNACIKLQDNQGPLCAFLLVGPHDVGKTEIAYAMAEHLFGQQQAVLRVNFDREYRLLKDITVFQRSQRETSLLNAIQQSPYAILLIEDIDQLSVKTFDFIKRIVEQGCVMDEENNSYDFTHAIILATTRLASDQMQHAITPPNSPENAKAIDLMQLVLNEHVQDTLQQNVTYPSPEELCDALMPKLMEHFPQHFLQKFNIIPFVPLDYAAFEKIIRAKIKTLGRRLHNSFGIELSFAPEVIKFLAHEALWRKANVKSLDQLLDQHLYSTVTHEILLHAEDKNRSKRLLIQLNESGQLLRCEFLTSNEAAFYNI